MPCAISKQTFVILGSVPLRKMCRCSILPCYLSDGIVEQCSTIAQFLIVVVSPSSHTSLPARKQRPSRWGWVWQQEAPLHVCDTANAVTYYRSIHA